MIKCEQNTFMFSRDIGICDFSLLFFFLFFFIFIILITKVPLNLNVSVEFLTNYI